MKLKEPDGSKYWLRTSKTGLYCSDRPVHGEISLQILPKEIRFEAGVDSLESGASAAVVPVAGPSTAVLLHQVSHLLKLLRVNISVSVQIKHLEGNLEMTEWGRLKIFLSVRLVELSPPGGGENSQEEDVVREADEAARSELVEDGLGVEVEAGGDSGDLRQGDLLELVQAEVLGLLLPRRYGPRPQFTNSKFVEFVPCQPYSLVVIDYSAR